MVVFAVIFIKIWNEHAPFFTLTTVYEIWGLEILCKTKRFWYLVNPNRINIEWLLNLVENLPATKSRIQFCSDELGMRIIHEQGLYTSYHDISISSQNATWVSSWCNG